MGICHAAQAGGEHGASQEISSRQSTKKSGQIRARTREDKSVDKYRCADKTRDSGLL